jgi:iron complex outermembrane receptor protein
MRCVRGLLLLVPATLSLPLLAQEQEAAVQEIVVTGSRIARSGFETPTPVTALSADDLTATSPGQVADVLATLPSMQGSQLPTSTGIQTATSAGASNLNLRGLGASRTLVLLNGRRFVSATAAGAPDIALFPNALISRVEVVTGGASAAYGSDAVSGVVNFILDRRLDGLKANVESSISEYGDDPNYKASLSYGSPFADGRGHFVSSAEYYKSEGLQGFGDRDWAAERYALVSNVTGSSPRLVNLPNVGFSVANYGGLVPSGLLRGVTFGPGGTVQRFDFGTFTSSVSQSGGDAVETSDLTDLVVGLQRKNAFGHGEYELTDNFTLFGEAMWAESDANFIGSSSQATQTRAYTIFNNNAYLPAAVAAQMAAASVTSFPLGRINRDFGPITVENRSRNYRAVGGFEGKFGAGWSYNGSFTHGENHRMLATRNNLIFENAYRAADAVVAPAGNAAGVAAGTIVCNSTLSNPGDGCVPMNLFGVGAPSAASIDYVTGDSIANQTIKQDVAELNVNGTPFSLWAGPVSIAAGVSYRRESTVQTVDPLSAHIKTCAGIPRGCAAAINNTPGGYQTTNPQPITGSFDVEEVYLESELPLLRDKPLAQAVDLNAAVRYAHYSLSGGVVPWKVGLTWQMIDDVKLRGTYSNDIRAANLNELFQAGSQAQGSVFDPFRNNQQAAYFSSTTGNPELVPEDSRTITGGIVFEPSFIQGLRTSIDYYTIRISGAIGNVAAQDIVNGCFTGNQVFCSYIQRTPAGVISNFTLPFQNSDKLSTSGVDVEADYALDDFLGGSGLFRAMINHTADYKTQLGNGTVTVGVGQLGRPKWRGQLTQQYSRNALSVSLQERFVGGLVLSRAYVEGVDISPEDNHVGPRVYFDLSAKYKLGEAWQLYGTVHNLANLEPPNNIHTLGTSGIGLANIDYDNVGRYFTLGVRYAL